MRVMTLDSISMDVSSPQLSSGIRCLLHFIHFFPLLFPPSFVVLLSTPQPIFFFSPSLRCIPLGTTQHPKYNYSPQLNGEEGSLGITINRKWSEGLDWGGNGKSLIQLAEPRQQAPSGSYPGISGIKQCCSNHKRNCRPHQYTHASTHTTDSHPSHFQVFLSYSAFVYDTDWIEMSLFFVWVLAKLYSLLKPWTIHALMIIISELKWINPHQDTKKARLLSLLVHGNRTRKLG